MGKPKPPEARSSEEEGLLGLGQEPPLAREMSSIPTPNPLSQSRQATLSEGGLLPTEEGQCLRRLVLLETQESNHWYTLPSMCFVPLQ